MSNEQGNLPSFDELQAKPKLPSFDALKAPTPVPLAPTTPPVPVAPPSFDELQRMQPKKPTLPGFDELQKLNAQRKNDEARKKREEARKATPVTNNTRSQYVKVRNALSLPQFRAKHNIKGSALFYRYVRLPDENNMFLPGPKGGAAILIELQEPSKFQFSFAVCSPEDSFSFDEARVLCQKRFAAGVVLKVENYDRNTSTVEAIQAALEAYMAGEQLGEPRITYRSKFATNQHLQMLLDTIDENYQL
jgi:hypothetical protein